MNGKRWIGVFLAVTIGCLSILAAWVYKVDPYMHYHLPVTDTYFYRLSNQRSQNDGIIKHFDYDAIVTGTSMTENFKASEVNEIFGCKSIKVPFSGASYKEINDNLKVAIEYNPNLSTVIRCLDMYRFLDDKDIMRLDLGDYPTYLYNKNVFDDVKYLLNRDIIWNWTYPMVNDNDAEGFKSGITSFDEYSFWQNTCTYGVNTVCPDGIIEVGASETVHLTKEEKDTIVGNITQNVTSLAHENPDITFYYFFSPYSITFWKELVDGGSLEKHIEAEQLIIELMLECENIKLYSFNNRTEIITDLNNYKDNIHYGGWINSLMLRWMYDGKYMLTKDNYKQYLNEELNFYKNYDYSQLNNQVDYEDNLYAAALLNEELTGAMPVELLKDSNVSVELSSSTIEDNQYDGTEGIVCTGSLSRIPSDSDDVFEHVKTTEFIGAKITVNDINKYGYISFYGKKNNDAGQPTVFVVDESGNKAAELRKSYHDVDNEWHQYVIDITSLKGNATFIFNGGYIDNTGNSDAEYVFSNIVLY